MGAAVTFSDFNLDPLVWPAPWTGLGAMDGLDLQYFDKPLGGATIPLVLATDVGCFFTFQAPQDRPGAAVIFSDLSLDQLTWPEAWTGLGAIDGLDVQYFDKPLGGATPPLVLATDSGCFFQFQIPPVPPPPPGPPPSRKECILIEPTQKTVDLRLTVEPWEGPIV